MRKPGLFHVVLGLGAAVSLVAVVGSSFAQAPAVPGRGAGFVGVTQVTTRGRIVRAGSEPGLASAAGLCADQFGAGAHMCNKEEIAASSAHGVFTASTVLPRAWIDMPNAVDRGEAPGPSPTCLSHTYGTHDKGHTGQVVSWSKQPAGNMGLQFFSGNNAPCFASLPIACCK